MTSVVMDSDSDSLSPYKVVRFFQACLNGAGNPIVFTTPGGAPAQHAHAKRLIAACKCDWREIRALIEEYCSDPWWVENQPNLAQVIKQLNRLQVERKKKVEDCHGYAATWEEL